MRRFPLVVSGIVFVYGLTAMVLSWVWLEDMFSDYASWISYGLSILFYPWMVFMFWAGSLFRRVELPTQGDWVSMPTIFGQVVLIAFISGLVYGLVWILAKMVHKD